MLDRRTFLQRTALASLAVQFPVFARSAAQTVKGGTMKLVLTEFVSLDGVSQGPGSPDEDPSGGFTRGGWFVPFVDAAFMQTVTNWIDAADAFLFGRQTYEDFAKHWPTVTDPGDVVAKKLNGVPKYVVSKSLREANWKPTTILSNDIPAQVARIKRQPGREIQIHGSARLAHSLITEGLVDEVRLAIAPVVIGQGRKLFPDGGPPLGFKLLSHDTTPAGLAIHIYAPAGTPNFATYGAR
jgi:dihydrofolate reductase